MTKCWLYIFRVWVQMKTHLLKLSAHELTQKYMESSLHTKSVSVGKLFTKIIKTNICDVINKNWRIKRWKPCQCKLLIPSVVIPGYLKNESKHCNSPFFVSNYHVPVCHPFPQHQPSTSLHTIMLEWLWHLVVGVSVTFLIFTMTRIYFFFSIQDRIRERHCFWHIRGLPETHGGTG